MSAAIAVLRRVPFPILRVTARSLVMGPARWLHGREADANLAMAFGETMTPERRREVVRAMSRGLADLGAEALAYRTQGPRFLRARMDHDRAAARLHEVESRIPGGYIVLGGHIGNWELLAQWLYLTTTRPLAGAVAKRIPNPHLNRIVERMRAAHGVATIYRDDPPARMLQLLREGKSVGVVPDQDIEDMAGTFVEFMGRPAYTPLGPARLAWAAKVPIVVVALIREGERHAVVVNDPIWPDRTRPKTEELVRLTQEWSRQIEAIIRAHPEQWPWFHDRWRTTPELLAKKGRAMPSASESIPEPVAE